MTKMSIDDITPEEWDFFRKDYLDSIDSKVVDVVNKPAHYNKGGIECIDYIEQQLGEGFIEYCEGNVHKYLHRWRYKNGSEDLQKARWYLQRMIQKVLEVGE